MPRRRKVGRPRGRKGGPAGSSLLTQMAAYRDELMAQQSGIQDQIIKLDAAMRTLGGAPRAAVGRRPTLGVRRGRGGGIREGSLKSYILKVMRPGEVMAVKDIAALVRSRGYRTDSSNFANQVSNALAQIPTVRKVSRGKFKV